MLLVQVDSTLSGLIGNVITMGKVLSNDAASWLLFLGDLVTITLGLCSIVTSIILGRASGAGNPDMSRSKLGVVEEKRSLRGSLLFKGHSCILGLADRFDLDARDFTAVVGSALPRIIYGD